MYLLNYKNYIIFVCHGFINNLIIFFIIKLIILNFQKYYLYPLLKQIIVYKKILVKMVKSWLA